MERITESISNIIFTKGRVVAVEANTCLCDQIRSRFASAIAEERLIVLNLAVADREASGPIPFYIHKHNHVLSQLPRPANIEEFDAVEVTSRTPANIVREFGDPSYIKVDVEHYDAAVLRNLFEAGIFPGEISAEAHSVDVFGLMVAAGYNSFCLVEGASVARRYPGFAAHSAGPFADDIGGRWDDANTFLFTLAAEGLGWKDIHASNVIPPSPKPSGDDARSTSGQIAVTAFLPKANAIRAEIVRRTWSWPCRSDGGNGSKTDTRLMAGMGPKQTLR